MPDTQEQLQRLKQRLAAIDERYSAVKSSSRTAVISCKQTPLPHPEDCTEVQVVSNEFGEHLQWERVYKSDQRHGSAVIGALAQLPHDLLSTLAADQAVCTSPTRWAFLDTETTGLAGGSGTYAFLIGVGRITCDGFRVRQFFMREYAEEASLLAALSQHLQQFEVLVTFNGKTYDQPLLETRYRMNRSRTPFSEMAHLDLLYGSRRIWKQRLQSCKLTELEQQVLGFHRTDDVPGHLIPYIYFEYLRSREEWRLKPVFHHNALDIVTLACLTSIVPAAFRDCNQRSLHTLGIQRGEDLLGIANWLLAEAEPEAALALLRSAIEVRLPDTLLFQTLWTVGLLEKKLKSPEAALQVFTALSQCQNPYQIAALEELAKYYEHQTGNYRLALDFTEQALLLGTTETLARRHARLQRRVLKASGLLST